MAALSPSQVSLLLEPYATELPHGVSEQLSTYLDLLLRWNEKTNLTSIRNPETIVTRHFGESIFLARHLPSCRTLLDLGSGAGFPGVPVQLMRPGLAVTLAESQSKKVSFLREVIRTLGLPSKVWAARAEQLVGLSTFEVVALRAVDRPELALSVARRLISPGGMILLLGNGVVDSERQLAVPGREQSFLSFLRG